LPKLPSDLSPQGLADVPWIANRTLKRPLDWVFERAGERVSLTAKPSVVADMTPATLACVVAGAGVTVLPDFLVDAEIRGGRLVPLLPGWSLPDGGIHVIYPSFRFRPAKVRHFVEMLEEAERARRQS
jgi:DNA-binding transcriptional LysR family regulator